MRGVPVGIELFRSHVFLVNNRISLYGLSRFLPMGGSTCAIVGCGACNSRHKGLSFHRIPKFGKNKETEEWRQRLIHAVNRVDCPAYRLHCSPMKNAQTEAAEPGGTGGTCPPPPTFLPRV